MQESTHSAIATAVEARTQLEAEASKTMARISAEIEVAEAAVTRELASAQGVLDSIATSAARVEAEVAARLSAARLGEERADAAFRLADSDAAIASGGDGAIANRNAAEVSHRQARSVRVAIEGELQNASIASTAANTKRAAGPVDAALPYPRDRLRALGGRRAAALEMANEVGRSFVGTGVPAGEIKALFAAQDHLARLASADDWTRNIAAENSETVLKGLLYEMAETDTRLTDPNGPGTLEQIRGIATGSFGVLASESARVGKARQKELYAGKAAHHREINARARIAGLVKERNDAHGRITGWLATDSHKTAADLRQCDIDAKVISDFAAQVDALVEDAGGRQWLEASGLIRSPEPARISRR